MSAIADCSPLTREDLARLAEYFSSDKVSFFGMYLDEVDGLFAAIACTPEEIAPPDWLPLVFGRDDPDFASAAESEAIVGGLMRMFNHVDEQINREGDYRPVLSAVTTETGEDRVCVERWAGGFIEGMRLREEIWFEGDGDELAALISTLFVLAKIDPPELEPAPGVMRGPEPLEEKIPRLVYLIRDFWRYIMDAEREQAVFDDEKPDTDDPCPCGSGKPYGLCCGRVTFILN